MKGFTQTFHFWKESRRAQSVPLNALLTYVTVPWYSIIAGNSIFLQIVATLMNVSLLWWVLIVFLAAYA